MAGTYVLKARDLGHARALASMTPGTDGEVEVRPIFGSLGIRNRLDRRRRGVTAARRHKWA
jgi:hypothetical protein